MATNNLVSVNTNHTSSPTTLQTDKILNNATLSLVDCFGRTVRQLDNICGSAITLKRDNLPGGLYFVWLIQDGKVIGTNKFVVGDVAKH